MYAVWSIKTSSYTRMQNQENFVFHYNPCLINSSDRALCDVTRSIPTVAIAGIFFKPARCGYTLRVTSHKASYSPEYINQHSKYHKYQNSYFPTMTCQPECWKILGKTVEKQQEMSLYFVRVCFEIDTRENEIYIFCCKRAQFCGKPVTNLAWLDGHYVNVFVCLSCYGWLCLPSYISDKFWWISLHYDLNCLSFHLQQNGRG
jgi:hypothetical protein